MIENLIIGAALILLCLAVQCMFVAGGLRLVLALDRRHLVRPTFLSTTAVLAIVLLLLMAGNLIQMFAWAALFVCLGEFATIDVAFYHSVVNFTTVGYGDVVMSEDRRLLGALEAANGILMLGLSTSITFLLLNRLMREAWRQRTGSYPDERPLSSTPPE